MELICNDDEEDALDIEENLETEEDALDMEENLETEENEDHVAEALGDDQPLKDFIDLQKENKRLKKKEIEKLRKEIEVLESKNKQLVEQIKENAVHATTQGFASKEMPHAKGVEQEQNFGIQTTLKEIPIVVEPLQTSMVKKIKIKARKKKEMSNFECEPREAKKKKTTKQAIEVISKEVIYVDNLPLSQPKPVERVLKWTICYIA
ncbi:unnamed protein product [Camellia sinensis]